MKVLFFAFSLILSASAFSQSETFSNPALGGSKTDIEARRSSGERIKYHIVPKDSILQQRMEEQGDFKRPDGSMKNTGNKRQREKSEESNVDHLSL